MHVSVMEDEGGRVYMCVFFFSRVTTAETVRNYIQPHHRVSNNYMHFSFFTLRLLCRSTQ
jgi:hypothetical protein